LEHSLRLTYRVPQKAPEPKAGGRWRPGGKARWGGSGRPSGRRRWPCRASGARRALAVHLGLGAPEGAIARGIPAREVAGRNAEEREAKARALYPELFQALLEAEEALTRAKFRLEMAKARAQEVEILAGLVG
jgi:hypothetical protein